MDVSQLFWNASLDELKQGYKQEGDYYTCLLCGETTENGIIYQEDGVLYDARKYMHMHITSTHESVFHYLIGLDKKVTGLTEHQNNLLRLFYEGKSDADIQENTGIGSASTIRNHRFVLKEKERQAKVFLTMMELLKEKDTHAPTFIPVHKHATMVDDRYNITEEERDKVLAKYFSDGMLKTFAMKEKYKIIVLREIVKRFDSEATYHEKEVNEIIKAVYNDYVTVRRYLIEYGFLDRNRDGSQYFLKK
ncbi:DUF2087 domain-containing protein [Priestia taiwanensis]|uniref:Transcriptional regulator n=1 Tax=Priestia taiwanensis TaxID=1347902 RepID=A0A917EPT5_9BACI|nr:DUF2087 domain-containing protein [Priestia taiwanensis]MBM7363193.1 hypothetical protein [Priestia taiwanensis]GGE68416.1 transcriptional regulator [Priestia taiwanensis]